MTTLLSDPLISAIGVLENGEPLVRLDPRLGRRTFVRSGLADRLLLADALLPAGIGLHVVEGHRSPAAQQAIVNSYSAELCAAHPGISPSELRRLSSRFVAPLEVAPHVAGAAVDLTLVDACGQQLDLGTPIDATPEQSDGACYTEAPGLSAEARHHRGLLGAALDSAGLVNYPTEWWHWSYGDRYWALVSGAAAALYGPVETASAAA
jgi:D-alanyl-D-alanine dipeptidase